MARHNAQQVRLDAWPGRSDEDPTWNRDMLAQTWTDERLELLKSGFADGLSCREIAATIGVSRNAVIGKISRLNLKREKDRMVRTGKPERTGETRPRGAPRLRQILLKAYPATRDAAVVADEPIHNGHT